MLLRWGREGGRWGETDHLTGVSETVYDGDATLCRAVLPFAWGRHGMARNAEDAGIISHDLYWIKATRSASRAAYPARVHVYCIMSA